MWLNLYGRQAVRRNVKNRQRMHFFVVFACFRSYVGQPDNHKGWVTSMPFALIYPTYPGTNPWNFHEKILRSELPPSPLVQLGSDVIGFKIGNHTLNAASKASLCLRSDDFFSIRNMAPDILRLLFISIRNSKDQPRCKLAINNVVQWSTAVFRCCAVSATCCL